MELALRFVIFRRLRGEDLTGLKDVGQFITDQMLILAGDPEFDTEIEGRVFREVFEALYRVVGSDAFRRYDARTGRFQGGFSISAYEAIAIGIAGNEDNPRIPEDQLNARIKELWSSTEFNQAWGAGVSGSSRIPRLIPFGRRWFRA